MLSLLMPALTEKFKIRFLQNRRLILVNIFKLREMDENGETYSGVLTKGAFNNYVDHFLPNFYHLPTFG